MVNLKMVVEFEAYKDPFFSFLPFQVITHGQKVTVDFDHIKEEYHGSYIYYDMFKLDESYTNTELLEYVEYIEGITEINNFHVEDAVIHKIHKMVFYFETGEEVPIPELALRRLNKKIEQDTKGRNLC